MDIDGRSYMQEIIKVAHQGTSFWTSSTVCLSFSSPSHKSQTLRPCFCWGDKMSLLFLCCPDCCIWVEEVVRSGMYVGRSGRIRSAGFAYLDLCRPELGCRKGRLSHSLTHWGIFHFECNCRLGSNLKDIRSYLGHFSPLEEEGEEGCCTHFLECVQG